MALCGPMFQILDSSYLSRPVFSVVHFITICLISLHMEITVFSHRELQATGRDRIDVGGGDLRFLVWKVEPRALFLIYVYILHREFLEVTPVTHQAFTQTILRVLRQWFLQTVLQVLHLTMACRLLTCLPVTTHCTPYRSSLTMQIKMSNFQEA